MEEGGGALVVDMALRPFPDQAVLAKIVVLDILNLGSSEAWLLSGLDLSSAACLRQLSLHGGRLLAGGAQLLAAMVSCLELAKALQLLWVGQNKLVSVPAVVGNLRALQQLWIGHNSLTTLPKELCELRALQELWVEHNRLEDLPPELGQLQTLLVLRVEHNQLATLPIELGELCLLQELGEVTCIETVLKYSGTIVLIFLCVLSQHSGTIICRTFHQNSANCKHCELCE
jgi:hypothetical protein